MKAPSVLLVVAILLSASAAPLFSEAPARDHDIVADDYFSIADILTVALSPDGKSVAYTERRWEPPAEKRNTELWVLDVASRATTRLSFDRATEAAPAWSPDGRFIYFTADYSRAGEGQPPYDGSTQVWRISPEGGNPQPVTRVGDGIHHFDLSADGRTLFYVVGEEQTDDAWQEMRKEHDELIYGHGVTTFSQVWKLDLASWRADKVIDERRVIKSMDASPDGRRIAMVTTPDEELIHHEGWSRVDVWDAATGEVVTVTEEGWRDAHPSPFGWINEVVFAQDGNALAFSVSFDGYPTLLFATVLSDGGFRTFELERPDEVFVNGGSLAWRPGSRDLAFIADRRARARVYAVTGIGGRSTGSEVVTPGEVTAEAFDLGADGGVVVTSTLTDPPDIYAIGDDGSLDRLTKVNPQVDSWRLPQIQLVRWSSADGRTVEGILELPPGYEPEDGPLPLVVELHGGPTSATQYKLRFWIYGRTLMAAKGRALLSPNYRGSTGYGDDFLVELIGRENDIDVKDILSGVDAMIERGIADPERLAVMGWSNGGFLTNCVITSTSRFKAASSGAGVLDMVLQWSIEDTPGHVINYMEGNLPWADPQEYLAGSPLYKMGEVVTPTLIHVGEKDERVPVAHSIALHRALRQYLGVPTELVIYPGEGHGLTTYEHRKAKMEWDLAWFERYLEGGDQ